MLVLYFYDVSQILGHHLEPSASFLFSKVFEYTVLAGFNEFGFNESSRFNESVLTSKVFFLLHKNSDLTNIRV